MLEDLFLYHLLSEGIAPARCLANSLSAVMRYLPGIWAAQVFPLSAASSPISGARPPFRRRSALDPSSGWNRTRKLRSALPIAWKRWLLLRGPMGKEPFAQRRGEAEEEPGELLPQSSRSDDGNLHSGRPTPSCAPDERSRWDSLAVPLRPWIPRSGGSACLQKMLLR